MSVSDDRQRVMPTLDDRSKGQTLAYPEAVLLTNPANRILRGEVGSLSLSLFFYFYFLFLFFQKIYIYLKFNSLKGEEKDVNFIIMLWAPGGWLQVDDKYQYSSESKDNNLHGWISKNPPVGFWIITPSSEFRTSGPLKQELTSHAGPIALSVSRPILLSGPIFNFFSLLF